MSDNFKPWPPPTPPQEFFDAIEKQFKSYLFFEKQKEGVRKFTCSHCRETFLNGRRVINQLMTPEDYDLWSVRHLDEAVCPMCHEKMTAINKKLNDLSKFGQMVCNIALMATNENDVWFDCYISDKYPDGRIEHIQMMFYHFTPGRAEFFKKDARNDMMYRRKVVEEPFSWNHGMYCEKYDYVQYSYASLSDTFLRYNNYYAYSHAGSYSAAIPRMKYLAWFARHPQLEMLCKLGHFDLVREICFDNTDYPSFYDWTAQKPWQLFRLTHEEYNAWKKDGADLDVFRAFKRMKYSGVKGMERAISVCKSFGMGQRFVNSRVKSFYHFVANCRKFRIDPWDVCRYVEKVQRESRGGCHQCPGITMMQAWTLWKDYADMVIKYGMQKTMSATPKDLKDAHDRMLANSKTFVYKDKHSAKTMRKQLKQIYQRTEAEAKRFERKYKTVAKIYKSIAVKYTYRNDTYTIVVPTGISDIVAEGTFLGNCIGRGVERYYERIVRKESFILFLRRTENPDIPYYTLEVEPNGTIRQKRSWGDHQYKDLDDALPFLQEWQAEVQKRLTAEDKKLAKKSAAQRLLDYKELRETKVKVRSGYLAGQLLADVLEADLLEVGFAEAPQKKKKTKERKAG